MIGRGPLCLYCLLVHLAHLGFWVLMELTVPSPERTSAVPFAAGAVFAAVLVLLSGFYGWRTREQLEQAHRDWSDSVDQIAVTQSNPAEAMAGVKTLAGRYRVGSAAAPLRVVVFTNYRCPACSRFDDQLESLLRDRDDVSVEIKHLTACRHEQRSPRSDDPIDPCEAALASEAAGVVGGAESFWAMHRWLMQRQGQCNYSELDAALTDLGVGADTLSAFHAAMRDPQTRRRLEADRRAADELGIVRTPTVFVNGIEVRGWQRVGVQETISAIADRRRSVTRNTR
jgi:protein-disulfide isomerase